MLTDYVRPTASYHPRQVNDSGYRDDRGRLICLRVYAVTRDDRGGTIVARCQRETDAADLAGRINACATADEARDVTDAWHRGRSSTERRRGL